VTSDGSTQVERICHKCADKFMTPERVVVISGVEHDMTDQWCQKCHIEMNSTDEHRRKASLDMARAGVRRKWREEWSGIPAKYQLTVFETFVRDRQPQAYDLIKEYAENYDGYAKGMPSIFLYSEAPLYGVGKTHLMAAMGHRILDRWVGDPEHSTIPIRFIAERELFRNIRASYNQNPDGGRPVVTEEMIYRRLTTAPLLLLDDLGKEKVTNMDFVQRVYWNLIDARYQADLPIVISANYNLDGVSRLLGQATAERIMEMTRGNIIEMKGKSFRFGEGK
jgi:DNA replication protein DnaC